MERYLSMNRDQLVRELIQRDETVDILRTKAQYLRFKIKVLRGAIARGEVA